jgi:restriction system protein
MARRRQSGFEDLVDVAAMLPCWVAVLLAIVAYIVISPYAEAPSPTPTSLEAMGPAITQQLFRTLAMFGQYLVPAAFLVGAVVSAIGRSKRKKLPCGGQPWLAICQSF